MGGGGRAADVRAEHRGDRPAVRDPRRPHSAGGAPGRLALRAADALRVRAEPASRRGARADSAAGAAGQGGPGDSVAMVMGDLVREVDVAVVGGGPGGYAAAFRCAELGLETVVVDAGKRLGGACLFEGCIPSKALLHVAAVLGEVERAREVGIDFGEPRVSLDPLRKWKTERVVGKLARGLASVARGKGVEVIGGRAEFEDSRSVRVTGDEPQKIRFRRAVVATGSSPSPLPGVELGGERVMDSTAALEIADVPERLLVIGGGYIGLELGQVYAALGSAVTLVEMTDGLLPGVDRDLVQPLARRCDKAFKAIHLDTRVADLREAAGGVEVRLGAEAAAFDRVLMAVGGGPQTAGLGLQTNPIPPTERGL